MATKESNPVIAPSTADPADFDLIGHFYCGDSEELHGAYRTDHEYVIDRIGQEAFETLDMGKCQSCGSWYSHGAVYRHTPTGDLYTVGAICAANLFNLDSIAAKRTAQARKASEAKKNHDKGHALLESVLSEPYKLYRKFADGEVPFPHPKFGFFCEVLQSMTHQAHRKGTLSDRQVEFAAKLYHETVEFMSKAREQEEKFEPIPEEIRGIRSTIEGTVLSSKWVDNDFGGSLKMLVRDNRGFKVWGTVPSKLTDDERLNERMYGDGRDLTYGGAIKGATVRFDAKVVASKDDPTFGFYSRPSKAELVELKEV